MNTSHRSSQKNLRLRLAAIASSALLILTVGDAALPQYESARSKGSGEQQIIVNTDLVTLNVSVTDGDGFHVPGLTKVDFALTDNKIPQEITFFSDADLPLSVSIVFDVSASMSGKKIKKAKEALATFVRTSHLDDEYFVIGFSLQPTTWTGRVMATLLSTSCPI